MEKFFIMGTQRTGTTLLISLLNSSPIILCVGEALHPMAASKNKILNWEYSYQNYLRHSITKQGLHIFNRSGILKRYLKDLYSHTQFEAIGFKLLLYQTHRFSTLQKYFLENQVKVIKTNRKNYLKKYVSLSIARQRKLYGSSEKLETLKITIDKTLIINELNKIKEDDAFVENYIKGLRVINISYEDILADMDAQCLKIMDFLGLDPSEKLKSKLVKMNPDNLEEIIENYDEIKNILTGSEYEFCLH